MTEPAPSLENLNEQQLRALAQSLMDELTSKNQTLSRQQLTIDKLTHELAILRRLRFGRISEQLDAAQGQLFEEDALSDAAAIEAELARIAQPKPVVPRGKPHRLPLPAHLPRTEIRHEPDNTQCACGCQLQRIGEDISEKLDYTPGTFTVERHVRGRWVCRQCEQFTQAPMPAYVIDQGMPTPGLLAQVLVAKYADHLPLYRQQGIYAREGVQIPGSTLSEWVGQCGVQLQPLVDALKASLLGRDILHADETGLQMLDHRQKKVKAHRSYLWVYATPGDDGLKAVVYDFTDSRAGEHCRRFLGSWQGQLVCDDYSGYKACFAQGITELGCLAHARRKFFDVFTSNQSRTAEQALTVFRTLYRIERKGQRLAPADRQRLRERRARPVLDQFHAWLVAQRSQTHDGLAIAKAIDYSLNRWAALTRYLDDGRAPIDNNHAENLMRPIALGRKNWLLAGSLRAGQRAATIMSLIQSARLNGHDPHAYLKDVLTRLPTTKQKDIETLLPHNWKPVVS